jgi:hypothetical protein
MNKGGLARAAQMPMEPKVKKPKKVLEHIRIHPSMGGGVRVEHHFTSYEHPMELHEFGKGDGEKFRDHIEDHTGMSWNDDMGNKNDVDKAGSEPE